MIVGQGSGNVQISSDGSQPGVFPESNWNMVAPLSHNGVTVAWTITPFVSTKDARSKVDASLGLRLIQASNSSGWQIPIPTDRTDMKLGRNMATVVAQSHRGDNARAGVTVVFCGHEEPSLLEGAYRTELVATITEN